MNGFASGENHPLRLKEINERKTLKSLNPGVQQHPAVSQADPAPKHVCDMQTCLLPRLLLICVHTAQGLISYSRSMPEESKAERLVSILPTGHSKQCLQIISEAFHVLTGGLGRVQTPKQAMAAQNGLKQWQFHSGKL